MIYEFIDETEEDCETRNRRCNRSMSEKAQIKAEDLIRAIYIEHLTQQEAADNLNVSRTTIRRSFNNLKDKVKELKFLKRWPDFRLMHHYSDEASFFADYGVSAETLASIKERYSDEPHAPQVNWGVEPHFFHQQKKMKVNFILNPVNYSEKTIDSKTDAILNAAFNANTQ